MRSGKNRSTLAEEKKISRWQLHSQPREQPAKTGAKEPKAPEEARIHRKGTEQHFLN